MAKVTDAQLVGFLMYADSKLAYIEDIDNWMQKRASGTAKNVTKNIVKPVAKGKHVIPDVEPPVQMAYKGKVAPKSKNKTIDFYDKGADTDQAVTSNIADKVQAATRTASEPSKFYRSISKHPVAWPMTMAGVGGAAAFVPAYSMGSSIGGASAVNAARQQLTAEAEAAAAAQYTPILKAYEDRWRAAQRNNSNWWERLLNLFFANILDKASSPEV